MVVRLCTVLLGEDNSVGEQLQKSSPLLVATNTVLPLPSLMVSCLRSPLKLPSLCLTSSIKLSRDSSASGVTRAMPSRPGRVPTSVVLIWCPEMPLTTGIFFQDDVSTVFSTKPAEETTCAPRQPESMMSLLGVVRRACTVIGWSEVCPSPMSHVAQPVKKTSSVSSTSPSSSSELPSAPFCCKSSSSSSSKVISRASASLITFCLRTDLLLEDFVPLSDR